MARWMALMLMLGVMGLLMTVPVGLASATTITGEVVEMTGVNDLNATADAQARTGLGKLIAYGGVGATAAAFFGGYVGTSALAGAGTMVWIFGSRIVNSGMDSAQSAPLRETVVHLSTGLQTQLGFLGMRLVQDPVFYLALVVAVLLVAHARARTARWRLA